MERRRIRFSGHVQGVGFRMTAARVAARYPVTGWVRNEPDRTVLMEIQGNPEEIGRCLAELRNIMRENVSDESTQTLPIDAGERGFTIRR